MKASEVIMIGRKRSLQAASVASCRGSPGLGLCLAYSTIRMAFLQARPTSTTKPICVKMLTSMLRDDHARDRAEQAHRHDEDHGQRQRPAFVLRGQHEEHQHHGQHEDVHGRVARLKLQQGQLGPFGHAWTGASCLSATAFHQVDRLAGTDARGRARR